MSPSLSSPSGNGADVACTRGYTAWCLIRRAFSEYSCLRRYAVLNCLPTDNDGNADYGVGLSLGGLTDLGVGYNEPERREHTPPFNYYSIFRRHLVGNDAHDVHVGVDTGALGFGRVAVNDDLLPSKFATAFDDFVLLTRSTSGDSSVGDIHFGAGLQDLGHYDSDDLPL